MCILYSNIKLTWRKICHISIHPRLQTKIIFPIQSLKNTFFFSRLFKPICRLTSQICESNHRDFAESIQSQCCRNLDRSCGLCTFPFRTINHWFLWSKKKWQCYPVKTYGWKNMIKTLLNFQTCPTNNEMTSSMFKWISM